MRNRLITFLCAGMMAMTVMVSSGCMAHTHVVGDGGSAGEVEEQRQWYVLWGLVPINEVDTSTMAGPEENYTVETEITPLDFVINIFTGWVTVYSRTVTVTK